MISSHKIIILVFVLKKYALLHFWAWEHFSCIAVYGGAESLSDFIRNILISVLKMNEGLTGLERHERESLLTEFSFLGVLSL